MQIIIIAALSDNYIIGIDNKLPWSLPKDLRHFRELTLGKPIIMGRKTHESIGRILPNRRNIVLSRNKDFSPTDCEVYNSLEQALNKLHSYPEVFIIGGTDLYQQALPLATKMYLTLVHHDFIGDAYFPKWDAKEWEVVKQQDFQPDESNRYAFSFIVLRRAGSI